LYSEQYIIIGCALSQVNDGECWFTRFVHCGKIYPAPHKDAEAAWLRRTSPSAAEKRQRPEWRGYTSQAMFLAKGTPKPSPGPRFHRAVAPPRKDCRPYESRPRDCIPCDPAQRCATLGTMPNRPPVGCRQNLAAL